jgi:hypothetical protein
MAKQLTLNACRGLVFRYFLREGWLPPGTTDESWEGVTMKEMLFDDPPLPSDPHFQKRRASLDLISLFFVLGRDLDDPFEQLKDDALTLAEFAEWCHDHHR